MDNKNNFDDDLLMRLDTDDEFVSEDIDSYNKPDCKTPEEIRHDTRLLNGFRTFNILKSISTTVDRNHILILCYMYYSKKQPKNSKTKIPAQYRFEGIIDTISNYENYFREYCTNPTGRWVWFGDKHLPVRYKGDVTNRRAARWLLGRMKNVLPWEEFMRRINIPFWEGGWHATGYCNSEYLKMDLRTVYPEFLLTLKDNRFRNIRKKPYPSKQIFMGTAMKDYIEHVKNENDKLKGI